jgi:hypothetical protein
VELGYFITAGGARAAAVADGYVYLASGAAGLYVFRECSHGVFADGFESGDTSAWSTVVP